MIRPMGRIVVSRVTRVAWVAWVAWAVLLPSLAAAQPSGQGSSVMPSARDVAPVDLTGYWVAVVTEDWAWRMRTPPPGDYASVPLNDEGRRVADTWTEAQDGSCLAFGMAGLLRLPLRINIDWADGNTLRLRTDYGMQARLLRFPASAAPAPSANLQGFSVAEWQITQSVTGSGATAGILTSELDKPPWATLEVVTTRLTPAWLRRNGVPYSGNAVVTEQFDRFDDGEDQWLTVTTIVDDPLYLTEPFVTSSNFKRESNAAGWNPVACRPD